MTGVHPCAPPLLGDAAGLSNQEFNAVAVGRAAGQLFQGIRAVAVGHQAGHTSQGDFAVAIGRRAGESSQGDYSIAMGYAAGQISQHDNTIVLNALATPLDTTGTSQFLVKPIQNDLTPIGSGNWRNLKYNTLTGEIAYI